MIYKKRGNLQLVAVLSLFLVVVVRGSVEEDAANPCFEKCGLERSGDLLREHPCFDDLSELPDAIRLPLECFAECTKSTFDCSSQGLDLTSRFKRFINRTVMSIQSIFDLNLFSNSVWMMSNQMDTTETLLGFDPSNRHYNGPSGGAPSRDDGYTEKPSPSSDKDGSSSAGGSESDSSDGNRHVRNVDLHEGRFRSALGAFQDFFSPHSMRQPHHTWLSYFSTVDRDVSVDVKATDDGNDVLVEVDESVDSAKSENEEELSTSVWPWWSKVDTSTQELLTEELDAADTPGADLLSEKANGMTATVDIWSYVPTVSLEDTLDVAKTAGVLLFKVFIGLAFVSGIYLTWKKQHARSSASGSNLRKRNSRSQSSSTRKRQSTRDISRRKRLRSKVLDVQVVEAVDPDEEETESIPQSPSDDVEVDETMSDPGQGQDVVTQDDGCHDFVQTDVEEVPVVMSIEENVQSGFVENVKIPEARLTDAATEEGLEQMGDCMRELIQVPTKVQEAFDKPQELQIGFVEMSQQMTMPMDPCAGDVDQQIHKKRLEMEKYELKSVAPHDAQTDVRGFYDNFRPDMSLNDFMSLLDKSVKPEGSRGVEADAQSHESGSTRVSVQCTAVGSDDVMAPSTQICSTQTQQQREFQPRQTEVETPDNDLIVTQMYANYVAKNPHKRWVKALLQKRLTDGVQPSAPNPTPNATPTSNKTPNTVCSIDSYKQKGSSPAKCEVATTEGATVSMATHPDVLLARKLSIARHTVSDTSVTYVIR